MQIALSYDDSLTVHAWAEVISWDEDGSIQFDVINGGWTGIYQDGRLTVLQTKQCHPAKLVWQGFTPFSDYNEAIAWIQESVNKSSGRLRDYIWIPPAENQDDYDDDIPF